MHMAHGPFTVAQARVAGRAGKTSRGRACAQASADSGSSYRTNRGAPTAEQLGDADVERSARSLNSLQPARARTCHQGQRLGLVGRAAQLCVPVTGQAGMLSRALGAGSGPSCSQDRLPW